MNLNTEQQAALDLAVDLMKNSEDEIMDPDDCGNDPCSGCDTRHAVAEMIVSNPVRITKILTEQKAKFDAFNVRLEELDKEREALYAKKDALDAEVEAAYEQLKEELNTPAPILN